MHLAMPPRKTSRPPPYAARNQSGRFALPPALKNLLRSKAGRLLAAGVLGFFVLIWMLSGSGSTSKRTSKIVGGWKPANIPKPNIGSGPPVVIVTVIDPKANPTWVQKIKSNREEYAKRHGRSFFESSTLHHGYAILTHSQDILPSSPKMTNIPSATHRRHGPVYRLSATP